MFLIRENPLSVGHNSGDGLFTLRNKKKYTCKHLNDLENTLINGAHVLITALSVFIFSCLVKLGVAATKTVAQFQTSFERHSDEELPVLTHVLLLS